MIKALLLTTGIVANAAAGYAILTNIAPESAAKIESYARDRWLGWDAASCEASPIACLSSRYNTLRSLEREVDTTTVSIRSELDRVSRLVVEQEELVGRNAMFLDQGRAIFRDRSGFPDQPVQFAGRTYPTLGTLRAQLQLLFEEKGALEASLASARELRSQMQARLDTLMVQAGQISLAKRVVPAQIQLIRANRALADLGTNVTMIDGVIRGSEAGLNQSRQLIRTTRDLMAPATVGRAGATPEAFDAFMQRR